MCFSPQRRAILRHQNFKKVLREPQFFNMLTSECASRHSGVQFFDIRTSKSASRHLSFLTFWLLNVLLATAACNFCASELQKVLRPWGVLYIFIQNVLLATAACNFWFLLWPPDLRTRRFNRPTFRLTRHTNHWKNTAFRDFSNIWRGCIFFLLTFALLHLLSADLTTLLCFSTVHIVGSLLFKLPSIILLLNIILLFGPGGVGAMLGFCKSILKL